MKLAHLEVCNAVILTGSVTGAARLLHVSQPAVTKLVQSAENQLGFRLFTREKNRLVPTQEALELQPEIVQIATQIERLKEFSQGLRQRQSTLRVACVPSVAATLLPLAVAKFTEQHPQVTCQLQTNAHPDLVERLMRRQVDVGFSASTLPNPAVVEEPVATGFGVCVAPTGTFSKLKASVAWADLSKRRIIRVPAHTQFGGILIESDQDEVREPKEKDKTGRIMVTTNHLALRLVQQGVGVAAIDSFTASFADLSKVQVLPFAPGIPVQLIVSYRNQAKLSNAARQFIQTMASVARQSQTRLSALS
jgi:DNA-binding transcriptional LysR family regulator